jgi:hypothetical protein
MDRYAAGELACKPPSEGSVLELAPRIEAVPARLERRDRGRFADQCWGVEIGHHGLAVVLAETIDQSLEECKCFQTTIQRTPARDPSNIDREYAEAITTSEKQ